MDLRAFWNIIGDARSGARDDKDFLRRIDARLRMLKPEELMEFESHFEKIHTESYSWNLWGAAYLMNGGCGDDGFEYFRAWLIAQGKQTFEMVVKDPDALATVADRGRRASRGFEEFMHLARETYEEKTGEEMPDSDALFQGVVLSEPSERWDFNETTEMKKRFPKLFAKYGRA
jgi:Protein of unknown function (DUF4240)